MADGGVEARLSVVEYKVDQVQATVCAMDGKLDGIILERARWQTVFGGVSRVLWIAVGALVPIAIAAAASGAAAIMRAAPASAP